MPPRGGTPVRLAASVAALVLLASLFGGRSRAPLTAYPLQPGQSGTDAAAVAFAAAREVFHGIPLDDCLSNNPQRLDCITAESSAAEIARGIAVFGVSDAGQNSGFEAAMGRMQNGSWRLWFTSQNPYQLTRLPGDMVICAGGDGVHLRASPSADAAAVDTLPDATAVTGEEFVLTEPVDPGSAGFGWFRISSPESGWLYSKYLEAAVLNDHCALHNAQLGG